MRAGRRCSFCGTPYDDALQLISGEGVFICVRCVEACAGNFSGGSSWDQKRAGWVEHPPRSPWPRQRQSHFGDDVTCSFCRKAEPDLQWLVGSRERKTFICDECVGLAWATHAERDAAPPADAPVSKRRWSMRLRWPWQPPTDRAVSL